ncbi:RcnB family protein [Allorhizobium borbori]|uniref:Ni/Co efflux regulator RcnB n=1 Tax=Allorhizobium borbori TaxID=485907 RepID=A0A7W6K1F7_9HYPH|nr:RcnB family protein [Allorhizobium borbori]MBB4103458.1 Ni/Co efflux regulator RcnB [Allorhizobium borbori]PZU23878.1 MAG: hypothetical protein DI589_06360 [Shinella sp.]
MRKLFAALLAATVLAAPLAQAQAQSYRHEPPRKEWRGPQAHKPMVKRWHSGERLRPGMWQQRLGPREVRANRLPEPRRGQQWVRVGNQVLLVNMNGLILSVAR